MSRSCPFCDLKERTIKDNQTAILFLSNPHKTTGHLLVATKRHVEKPWELTEQEIKDIYELIFFVERKLIGKLGDGFDVRQNYRPFMKQSRVKVDHIHYHIIPRTNEDRVYQISEKHDYELWEDLTQAESEKVLKLLSSKVCGV